MKYALYTERPVTSRASLFFAQTSLLAPIKDTYCMKFSVVWTERNGRTGGTGMVVWINMRRAIEIITSTFNWQEIENVAST